MRFKMMREMYIPKGAEEIRDDETKTVAYTYKRGSMLYALGFGGKRQKPDWHYRFETEQERADYIQKYFDNQREHLEWKAARRAEQRAFKTSLVIGDILYTSWGYDQTNVDWFEVVEVKPSGKTVVIREIAGDLEQSGFMSGRTTPLKGRFIGEPLTKRVQRGDSVKIHSSAYASPWDGKPKHTSWYH